jgi:glycosyltransferase involved in cell wall biosynthesis
MRRFFGLPDTPAIQVIGQVSRLVPYKGHRVLLKAARMVVDEEPRAMFLLCGYSNPPEYADELRREATELGIGDRVRIASYAGPIGDVWTSIDIHVHASERDSSPIAIHESMALGLPVVTTDVGGVRELVYDEETGLVVNQGDAHTLATALLRILRNSELARSLGTKAKARFCMQYQAATMTRRLEDLFAELAIRRFEQRRIRGGSRI